MFLFWRFLCFPKLTLELNTKMFFHKWFFNLLSSLFKSFLASNMVTTVTFNIVVLLYYIFSTLCTSFLYLTYWYIVIQGHPCGVWDPRKIYFCRFPKCTTKFMGPCRIVIYQWSFRIMGREEVIPYLLSNQSLWRFSIELKRHSLLLFMSKNHLFLFFTAKCIISS